MRTVGDLALLTGISVNTIKYYAKPYQPDKEGRRSTGAGYLTPTPGRNGVRLFNDSDLMLTYVIGLLHKSNVDQETIRKLSQHKDGISKTIEHGLAKIEEEKAELSRREQTLKQLQRAAAALNSEDDSSEEAFFNEMMQLAINDGTEYLVRLWKKSPDLFADVRLNKENAELAKRYYKLKTRRDSLVRNGATSETIEKVDNQLYAIEMKINPNLDDSVPCLDRLFMLYEDHANPSIDGVQNAIGDLRRSAFSLVPIPLFEEFVKAMFTGNSLAVFLDLAEEGFVKWLLKAVHIYVSTSGKEAAIG